MMNNTTQLYWKQISPRLMRKKHQIKTPIKGNVQEYSDMSDHLTEYTLDCVSECIYVCVWVCVCVSECIFVCVCVFVGVPEDEDVGRTMRALRGDVELQSSPAHPRVHTHRSSLLHT